MTDLTAQTPVFGVPTAAPTAAAPQASVPVAAPSTAGPRYEEQDGKHRGVAGVARDILGTLGDFLLTRLHMPAMYGPAQERRRESAATANFDTDPVGAISRLESINPEAGRELRNQYIDNQRLAAQQESTAEVRDARLQLAQQVADQRTRTYAASMLGSMSTWDEARRRQYYPQMRAQVLSAASRQGADLSPELPETYDPVALDAFIDGAVPVGTQRTQRLSGERIATTRRGQDLSDKARAASLEETRRKNRAAEEDRDATRASVDRRGQASQAETNRRNRAAEEDRDETRTSVERRRNTAPEVRELPGREGLWTRDRNGNIVPYVRN